MVNLSLPLSWPGEHHPISTNTHVPLVSATSTTSANVQVGARRRELQVTDRAHSSPQLPSTDARELSPAHTLEADTRLTKHPTPSPSSSSTFTAMTTVLDPLSQASYPQGWPHPQLPSVVLSPYSSDPQGIASDNMSLSWYMKLMSLVSDIHKVDI